MRFRAKFPQNLPEMVWERVRAKGGGARKNAQEKEGSGAARQVGGDAPAVLPAAAAEGAEVAEVAEVAEAVMATSAPESALAAAVTFEVTQF